MNSPPQATEAFSTCAWCSMLGSKQALPEAFVWSKMEAESGQPIQTIVRRKDFERLNGNGLFFWGIGTGVKVEELLKKSPVPEVIFSLMRSKPKKTDVSPKEVLLWTQFLDADGAVRALPPHALVLSNAQTVRQANKERYYALVCYSPDSLLSPHNECLSFAHLRNFNGDKKALGFSQVTAVAEHVQAITPGVLYPVSMRAQLKSPYCAKLRGPVTLNEVDRFKITSVADDPHLTPLLWADFVASLRSRYG